MYMTSINDIIKTKVSAGIRWHSPMLDDISAVKSWEKVYSGLLKMYQVEVLGKLPIMQHFLFGKLIAFTPSVKHDAAEVDAGLTPGLRLHNLKGDCCGNPLPSIFAAGDANAPTASQQSDCAHEQLPVIPFD